MIRPAAVVVVCSFAALAVAQPKPASDPFGPAPAADIKPADFRTPADPLRPAVEAFQAGKYSSARDLFAQASKDKPLSADQFAAWAYCRVKVATDRLNGSTDAATAAEVAAEIDAALAAVPAQSALHAATRDILAAARRRAGTSKPAARPPEPTPGGDAIDSASFVVKYSGRKTTAEEVRRAAEAARLDLFKRWSGPPGTDWLPKCEIVLHPTADAFAAATGLPASATGRAEVKLDGTRVVARRIDLRADDDTLVEVALPRELTHVVIADLYPTQPPPPWAAVAMSVLGTTDAEVGRYLRTAAACDARRELPGAASLLNATEVPAKNVTGFHAGSVAAGEYLVRWKGEKAFTAFVRDSLRYGPEAALKRNYDFPDARALDDAMRRK